MRMNSDCYQLQENQRKNDPLTVKTPPPCLGCPSPLLASLAENIPPANHPPPLRQRFPCSPCPCPCINSPAARAKSSRASRAKTPQTLAAQGFPVNAEKVQFPAFTAAKVGRTWALYVRDHAQGCRASPGRRCPNSCECRARCPPGACLPPVPLHPSGHAPKRAACARPPI